MKTTQEGKYKHMGTEERILEAATKVFTEKGYEATRTRDIAQEANINIASLHYYYRSKEKLFELVVRRAMNDSSKHMDQIFSSNLPLHEKIRQFVVGYIDFLKVNPFIPMFILSESQKDPEKIDRLLNKDETMKKIEIQLESLIAEGVIRPINMTHFISNMIALVIFPFLSKSLLCMQNDLSEQDFQQMLEERKEMVPDMLINYLYLKIPE